MRTAIDRLYEESKDAMSVLEASNSVSARISAEDSFRKGLLLAAASYFEHETCRCVLSLVEDHSATSPLVAEFVRNKAVARQYHSWFKWDAQNANQFFGLFGSDFGRLMKKRVAESPELERAIRAFLELGHERNKLVHNDFATFQFEKTLDEVYGLYREALEFFNALPSAFRTMYRATQASPEV